MSRINNINYMMLKINRFSYLVRRWVGRLWMLDKIEFKRMGKLLRSWFFRLLFDFFLFIYLEANDKYIFILYTSSKNYFHHEIKRWWRKLMVKRINKSWVQLEFYATKSFDLFQEIFKLADVCMNWFSTSYKKW